MPTLRLPLKIKAEARATSHYSRELIHKRLKALAGRTDEAAEKERRFLKELLEKG